MMDMTATRIAIGHLRSQDYAIVDKSDSNSITGINRILFGKT